MSNIEQITKDPCEEVKAHREKDPKKVAAGKKLAESNKKAREALAREMKREAEMKKNKDESSDDSDSSETSSEGWIPDLSFSNVLTIIGLGFAAFNAYMMYRKRPDEVFDWQPVTTVMPSKEPPPSKIPVPVPTRDSPKIGML